MLFISIRCNSGVVKDLNTSSTSKKLIIITDAVTMFLLVLVLKVIKLNATAAKIGKSTGNNISIFNCIPSNNQIFLHSRSTNYKPDILFVIRLMIPFDDIPK